MMLGLWLAQAALRRQRYQLEFSLLIYPDMKTIFCLIVLCLAGLPTVSAQASDVGYIKMRDLSGFRLTLLSTNEVEKGANCVAGYAFDPEEAKSIAVGLVLNPSTLEISWAKAVRPTGDFHQNRFTGCFAAAGKIYFLEESDTQASPELSQVMINFSSVLSSQPSLVERSRIWADGKRNWLIGLFADSARVTVVLGHNQETGSHDAEMTVHQFSRETMVAEPAIRVKHGSFLSGSKVILDGKKLVIAGRFAKSGLDIDAAMAKAAISQTGNYIWAKPMHSDVIIGGPDRQGRLFEVQPNSERGTVSLVNVVTAAAPGIQLTLPSRDCVPQWLLPDVALISKACKKDMITIQKLAKPSRREVKFAFPKVVPGANTVLFYSPVESGADGYGFGVIAP
jgi:hypothetical protein